MYYEIASKLIKLLYFKFWIFRDIKCLIKECKVRISIKCRIFKIIFTAQD